MSALPTATHSAPGVPIYATAGGGAASTLQSPVAVLPDVTGATTVIAQATLAGDSTIEAIGSATGYGAIIVGGSGTNYQIVANTALIPGSQNNLVIGLDGGGAPAIAYTPSSHVLALGDGTAGGHVQTNNGLLINDPGGAGNSMVVTPVTASISAISQSIATNGSVVIGSSLACPGTVAVTDSGADTGRVLIGGNGGDNLFLQGSSGATPLVRSDALNSGTLLLGSSQNNPATIFVRDSGPANNGYVDIAGGIAASYAMRLQGVNATAPNATAVRLSTNIPFVGSNAGGQVLITTSPNGGTGVPQAAGFSGIQLQEVNGSTITTIYDQTYNSNPAQNPVGIRYPYNNFGVLSASLADQQSAAIPGLPFNNNYQGLYAINIYTTSTDIQSLSASISTIAYFSSATGWVGGAAGATTPNGNVRIVPIVAGGLTSLSFSNFTGSTITNMKYSVTCLTGAIAVPPS